MLKPAVATLLALPLFAISAFADTQTVEVDTLVVVTKNPPVIIIQGEGEPQSVTQPLSPPGAAEMPPPPPPPTRNGAPQNEDWNNVSHINGTPVKVGERNDYLYRFRKTNIMVNPFGPFFGLWDASVSHALGNHLVASVAVMAIEDEFLQFSATLPLYFRRAYSGPFLEGGLLLRTEKTYSDCYDYCENMSSAWVGPQLMFGWHWSFDVGLNISFAAGVAKRIDDGGDPDFNGYFRVGYAL